MKVNTRVVLGFCCLLAVLSGCRGDIETEEHVAEKDWHEGDVPTPSQPILVDCDKNGVAETQLGTAENCARCADDCGVDPCSWNGTPGVAWYVCGTPID